MSIMRKVDIRLSPESICRILEIPSVGLRVYEAKVWPTVLGFEPREAVQRLCGLADAQGMGKPSAHSLTVPSRGPIEDAPKPSLSPSGLLLPIEVRLRQR